MTVKRRVSNLCLAVLADTWADLTGIIEEIRAESAQGRTRADQASQGYVGRGPTRRKRVRLDVRSRGIASGVEGSSASDRT
jgi:hypothetical protein